MHPRDQAPRARLAAERQRRWPDMRMSSLLFLFVAVACGVLPPAPQIADGVADSLLHEMRRLADVDCPTPPEMYVLDGVWYVGWFGTVIGVADSVLAVQMDEPGMWSSDVQHLLMPVSDRQWRSGIKGNAVVVGRVGDTLVCRYFPNMLGAKDAPRLGDRTWVDHATSRELQASWSSQRR
jgi:hypothetical protein